MKGREQVWEKTVLVATFIRWLSVESCCWNCHPSSCSFAISDMLCAIYNSCMYKMSQNLDSIFLAEASTSKHYLCSTTYTFYYYCAEIQQMKSWKQVHWNGTKFHYRSTFTSDKWSEMVSQYSDNVKLCKTLLEC